MDHARLILLGKLLPVPVKDVSIIIFIVETESLRLLFQTSP
jgi:hypothetical protein